MLGGDEPAPPPAEEEPTRVIPEHTRKVPKRRGPSDDWPRVYIELIPPEVEREGLDAFDIIGQETRGVLERRPASCVLVEVVRKKFVRKADKQATETPVFIAEPLPLPIPKGMAGPGLLAETIVKRWCAHLPLHRQQAINSASFRNAVLDFRATRFGGEANESYRGAERIARCANGVGSCRFTVMSSTSVLQALLAGNRTDGTIQIGVSLTESANFANTGVGPPETPTELNPKWLRSASVRDEQVAENLIHEHMHRLGYEHDHGYARGRCASIPYAVGKLACDAVQGKDCWPGGNLPC